MTSIKNREKLLVIITATLLISVIIYNIIIEPQLMKRNQYLGILRNQQTILTKMRADLLVKDRIEESYKQIEPIIKSDGTDQQEMSRFSQEFQEFNKTFNLQPRTIKFLPIINDTHYRKILVKVELVGNIKNIARFISSVENSKKAFKFEKATFTAKERDDNIQLSFVLSKVISNTPNP